MLFIRGVWIVVVWDHIHHMDLCGRSQLFSFPPSPNLRLVLFLNHVIAHMGPYNGHDSLYGVSFTQ